MLSSTKRVGFLGPEGTFCQQAMLQYFEREDYQGVPCRSIPELLLSVEKADLHAAVVPVENSVEGSVNVTVDMLVHEVNIKITGEVTVPVVHNLLVKRVCDSRLDIHKSLHCGIKRVLSHPHALAQCRGYLERYLPEAQLEYTTSTAEAARLVGTGKGGEGSAAIGTLLAAEKYGLEVFDSAIQDAYNNETRFIIAGGDEKGSTGRDKTSLAFSLAKDRPGGLYRILKEFAVRDINLSKIESRPAGSGLGHYIFFIDCEGHENDDRVKEVLEVLRDKTTFLKVLGSYPRWGV